MRYPFVIPSQFHKKHSYEVFCDDAAGCLLCGYIHTCSNCDSSVETDEGHVCTITGLVVYPYVFSTKEFVETCTISKKNRRQVFTDVQKQHVDICNQIELYLQPLFISNTARRVFEAEQKKSIELFVGALLQHMTLRAKGKQRGAVTQCNIMRVMTFCLKEDNAFKYKTNSSNIIGFMTQHWKEEERKRILDSICSILQKFLLPLYASDILRMRPSETTDLLIGLTYLLRNGVHLHNIKILPRMEELNEILPSTIFLEKNFNIRAKSLTEVENRVKFTLRGMSAKQIQTLW